MLIGIGPVLRSEMITTARRPRYYVARAVYGLILLYVLWEQQSTWLWAQAVSRQFVGFRGAAIGGTHEQIRRFAESAFVNFIGVQGLVLLCLIPALVAGVIADEYQRKTLHYLLASRLSSAEIVLGKLGARLLHVATFVALGLPVVSLLALYGGLNPEHVLYGYLGTATTVLFAAGLSMLVSIVANRPRDAILATYALLGVWLWLPLSISRVAHAIRGPLFWVGTVNDWLLISNPIVAWTDLTRGPFAVTRMAALLRPRFLGHFYEMVALQSGLGLLFLVLAIVGLRPLRGSTWPVGKTHSGWARWLLETVRSIGRSNLAAPVFQNQLLAARSDRPACGDRAMLWKERYARPTGGLSWLSSPLVLIFCSVALGCYFFDVIQPVVTEIFRGNVTEGERAELNSAVRESSIVLGTLAMLTIAASASVSLIGEREADTWVSLATTHLTPSEIVGAKQFGALWSARRIGVALIVVWVIGLLLGGLHPMGFLATFALATGSAYFIASLGVFISSQARNGTRALVATFLVVFATGWTWPSLIWRTLVTAQELAILRYDPGAGHALGSATLEAVIRFGTIPSLYAGVAGLLTYWSIRRLRAHWGGS